ncbi:N-acetyltransferase [Micromonospora sp. NPDC092111]|uniref:N-acetyltransferase n=1 Tax=Micromonospora sp. NPDC092111 TaxID=3364289 RepID=UPI00381F10FE
MTRAVVVRRASGADLDALSVVVAQALSAGPLGGWLVPDATERPVALRRYARLVVSWGLRDGLVDTTDDRSAVAVWYPRVEVPVPSAVWTFDLHRALGPRASRFALLHACLDAVVPHIPHHHLAHVAARPGRDDAVPVLLAVHHRGLDAEGLPSYAEVPGGRPREGVLAGLGYEPRSPILLESGGPALWRMWRPTPGSSRAGGGLPRRDRLCRSGTPFRGQLIPVPPRSP